jgi:hypothetical protein
MPRLDLKATARFANNRAYPIILLSADRTTKKRSPEIPVHMVMGNIHHDPQILARNDVVTVYQ